jgi:hypothetical protein
MSFPPYPEKFDSFYNTGYKQFWGSGFPYIKDDFVGGSAGLQYPSDDDEKVRQKPVKDLQNVVSGYGRGTGRPKKKGGHKKLPEDHPMYVKPINKSRVRRRSEMMEGEEEMMEGEGADPELLRAVQKYRKDNKVSLKEAWAKVKEEMNFVKKVRQATGAKRGRPKKVKKVVKPKDMRGTRNVNRAFKKVKASDVMKYKHKTGVSLKQAWADLRNEDEV